MKHVLIVENEVGLLKGLLREFSQVQDLRVSGSTTLESAYSIIANEHPDLIVTDLDPSDGRGRALITFLSKRADSIPVIGTTSRRKNLTADWPPYPALELVDKPVSQRSLRKASIEILKARSEVRETSAFRLEDFLQLAALGHYSVRIEVQGHHGEQGMIEVFSGDIWTAEYGALSNHEALFALLDIDSPSIQTQRIQRPPKKKNLTDTIEHLILEYAHQRDERGRSHQVVSPEPTKSVPEIRPQADGLFDEFLLMGIKACLKGHFAQARESFLKALELRPDDARTLFNLKRVEELEIEARLGNSEAEPDGDRLDSEKPQKRANGRSGE